MSSQRSLHLSVLWCLAGFDLGYLPGTHVPQNPDPHLASSAPGGTDSGFIEPCCRVLRNKYSEINDFVKIFFPVDVRDTQRENVILSLCLINAMKT
jgi:hypothetical protein